MYIIQLTPSKLVLNNLKFIFTSRNISKYIHKDKCSKAIRQKFLDYFINDNDHVFVRSSPVVPYCDPTVPFVNAGMNQFKGVFLGTRIPHHTRVANSQKCIRIGGKHNDINEVGKDGFHHTFFEMLGNWSFGDYFKKDACRMAWNLLTNVYKIPKSKLYVTYFKGDETLNIPEDLETKEVWKELGIPEAKILPFGTQDNFWEMGLIGPCGPCTEIHYDHIGASNRAKFVNKGLHDLTEIWNIVFIEYNRLKDGTISHLPSRHVDTGMGFERLTSILQGKVSNYDTDNFRYLMRAIHKICSGLPRYGGKFGENDWNDLDKSYRILADHARMITVCLSDGVIPEENQKLRKILRKIFLLSEIVFKKDKGLLKELSNYVVDNLGPFYPEMERNIGQVHQIINYEEEVYRNVRQSAAKDWQALTKENPILLELDIIESPSFIRAYKEAKSSNVKEIDSQLAYKLYDTHGMDEEGITKISKALKLKFDPQEFVKGLESAKLSSKQGSSKSDCSVHSNLVSFGVDKTKDFFKYMYSKENDQYKFEDVSIEVLKIFHENSEVEKIESDYYCSLLLDKTNLYSEAGGQVSDRGTISFGEDSFEVDSLENVNGYVLHKGFFKSRTNALKPFVLGVLSIDEDHRKRCMRNHTGTHLLNTAIKNYKGAACQKSSQVNDKFLCYDVAVFGEKLATKDVAEIEKSVLRVIRRGIPVDVRVVDSEQLLQYDSITLIPGEVYPENAIRIVEIRDDGFVSREPCCGTHVLNTADIEDFCITGVKSLGRCTTSISAVTGDRARLARKNGAELMDEINAVKMYFEDNVDKPQVLEMAVATLRKRLNFKHDGESILPYSLKLECSEKLDSISKRIKDVVREKLRDFIEIEMKHALNSNVKTTKSNKKYLVHYLRSSMMLKHVPLHNATKLCQDLPILVISYADNTVKAQCCVPQDYRSESFDAEKWMKDTVAVVFDSKVEPPRGQDGALICNMKAKKINLQEWDPLLKDSLERAQLYVEENL